MKRKLLYLLTIILMIGVLLLTLTACEKEEKNEKRKTSVSYTGKSSPQELMHDFYEEVKWSETKKAIKYFNLEAGMACSILEDYDLDFDEVYNMLLDLDKGVSYIKKNYKNVVEAIEEHESFDAFLEKYKPEENNMFFATTKGKQKDWLVSRQRYWGAPIPVIYCDTCGTVVVPEEDLPVKLPYDVEFKPDGVSPLKKSKEFMNCKCPKCGKPATREADTLDTFVCSSWYQLRYADAMNEAEIFNKETVNKMNPVDCYVGGKEHAAMHLIYTRFMTKALRDMGYLKFDEPFQRLIHQGLILGPDGNKMSKSKGNTVSPDEF